MLETTCRTKFNNNDGNSISVPGDNKKLILGERKRVEDVDSTAEAAHNYHSISIRLMNDRRKAGKGNAIVGT